MGVLGFLAILAALACSAGASFVVLSAFARYAGMAPGWAWTGPAALVLVATYHVIRGFEEE